MPYRFRFPPRSKELRRHRAHREERAEEPSSSFYGCALSGLHSLRSSPMWTCCVSFVDSGTGSGQFVAARARVSRDVKSRVVIGPINQTILEYRIRSRDALWKGHRVAHFARRLRYGNIDGAQAMAVPGIKNDVFENRRIVVLLRLTPARLAVRLVDVLTETFIELIVRNRKRANHDRDDLGFHGHHARAIQRTTAVLVGQPDVCRPVLR